jgi:hypothetical protein
LLQALAHVISVESQAVTDVFETENPITVGLEKPAHDVIEQLLLLAMSCAKIFLKAPQGILQNSQHESFLGNQCLGTPIIEKAFNEQWVGLK